MLGRTIGGLQFGVAAAGSIMANATDMIVDMKIGGFICHSCRFQPESRPVKHGTPAAKQRFADIRNHGKASTKTGPVRPARLDGEQARGPARPVRRQECR